MLFRSVSQSRYQPSSNPSSRPTQKPSDQPTGKPSGQPSGEPTGQPSEQPSNQPSSLPTALPTGLELHDNFGTITLINLSKIRVNGNLGSEVFKFNPPPGADVLNVQ